MKKSWEFATAGIEGQKLEIDSIDVWAHPWIEEKEEPKARVKDPAYGQNFSFHVYRIDAPNKTVRFAAGEFSNASGDFMSLKRSLT
jgi:hypothetical protein